MGRFRQRGKLGAASLTDATGFALYTLPGRTRQLQLPRYLRENWPPLLAGAADTASAPYSLISRSDSELKQWAYNGKPLLLQRRQQLPTPKARARQRRFGNWPARKRPASALRPRQPLKRQRPGVYSEP